MVIQTVLIAGIYGLEKLLPGINKNATFLKLGKKWIILCTYIIPVISFILWIQAVLTNVIFVDLNTMLMEFGLLLIMLILPYILTRHKATRDDF